MVISMGSRMERHKKKNKYKSKKRKKLKILIVIFLVVSLILALYRLDLELRTSTSTKDQSICSFKLNENILNINLFGNNYYIDETRVKRRLKNLKGTIKRLKDQSALVF